MKSNFKKTLHFKMFQVTWASERTNANIFKGSRLIFKILLEAYVTFELLRYKIRKGIKYVLTCLIGSLNLLKGTSGSISLNCSAVESQEELCLNS